MAQATDRRLIRPGGHGKAPSAARHGFLPVPLRYAPLGALKDVAIFLRNEAAGEDGAVGVPFTLYRGANVPFTPEDRERLFETGREFAYVRFADQAQYHDQMDRAVSQAVADPAVALTEKSRIVYETTVAVADEILADPNVAAHSKQIEGLSRSISALILNEQGAFGYLFAVSRHDFYTATHLVNVATWMVPLAHALGYRAPGELAQVYQAGLLHDIGKIFVPEAILNHPGKLEPKQWQILRRHAMRGWWHLKTQRKVPETALDVCRQHHERLDGSGYPDGLRGHQIHELAKIAAVVDTFDAMTALRPYREKSLTVSDAILQVKAETPRLFDAQVVDAWIGLLSQVNDNDVQISTPSDGARAALGQAERRRNKRYSCQGVATVSVVSGPSDGGPAGSSETQVSLRNISRFGLGLLSPRPLEVGVRIRLQIENGRHGRIASGEVVRCRDCGDGTFEIGVKLLSQQR